MSMLKTYRISYFYTVQVDGGRTYSRHSDKNVSAYNYLDAAQRLAKGLKKKWLALTHVRIDFCQQQVTDNGRCRWASINTDLFSEMQSAADGIVAQ